MIELTKMWNNATDKGRWSARGASFMAKVKATRMVWFPPGPVDSGTKAASRAKKATKQTAKKTTKKANGTAKKAGSAAKKATGVKKATSGAKS